MTKMTNVVGIEFDKRPETCPNCKKCLKSKVRHLKESELPGFCVTASNPYLYNVIMVWNTKTDKRSGWLCGECNKRFCDGTEES
jgi:hypothetical protein